KPATLVITENIVIRSTVLNKFLIFIFYFMKLLILLELLKIMFWMILALDEVNNQISTFKKSIISSKNLILCFFVI
ncbi:MAG: hypothetical protein ACI4TX_00390, partial [Christensenellales bacterium]